MEAFKSMFSKTAKKIEKGAKVNREPVVLTCSYRTSRLTGRERGRLRYRMAKHAQCAYEEVSSIEEVRSIYHGAAEGTDIVWINLCAYPFKCRSVDVQEWLETLPA